MLRKIEIAGNPYVGVYAKCSEKHVLAPVSLARKTKHHIADALSAELLEITLACGTVLGALTVMNSNGIVVTNSVEPEELKKLSQFCRVAVLPDKLNAAGNNILANDYGTLVHPDLGKRALAVIHDALGVEVVRGTLGGGSVKTVGSAAVVTNKGALCHPKSTEAELQLVKDVLKVPAMIGTANFGTPLVGACIVANSKGACFSRNTTTVEITRIRDALDLD